MSMLKVKPTTLFRSLTLLAALLVPALVHGQDQRLRVSFGGATTAGAIDSQPAITASVGYRFADRFSFDVEVTAVDGAEDRFSSFQFLGQGVGPASIVRFGSTVADGGRGLVVPTISTGGFVGIPPFGLPFPPGGLRIERDGSTALATFGFRYELPSQVRRFLPYVSGGIGIARTEQHFTVSPAFGTVVPLGVSSAIRPFLDIDETVSHTGLAASAGVGASIRIFRQLSADLDARYFRLDRGGHLGRFGGGVSYRF